MTIRVLIVEDDTDIQLLYKELLLGLEVVCASTIEEAQNKFAANPNFNAIVMDACVPGHSPNTTSLVEEFRKTFKGPMIASSSESTYNNLLMRAGCDYKSFKYNLPQTLLQILHNIALLPHFK